MVRATDSTMTPPPPTYRYYQTYRANKVSSQVPDHRVESGAVIKSVVNNRTPGSHFGAHKVTGQ